MFVGELEFLIISQLIQFTCNFNLCTTSGSWSSYRIEHGFKYDDDNMLKLHVLFQCPSVRLSSVMFMDCDKITTATRIDFTP